MAIKPVSGKIKSQEINDNLSYLDSQKRNKNDLVKMNELSQEVKEGMTGGAVPVVGVGAVDTINLKQSAVTPEVTTFFKKTTNLFNKNNVTLDHYVRVTTGELVSGSGWVTTEYIPIDPSSSYIVKLIREVAYYDEKRDFISGQTMTGGYDNKILNNIPLNAKYLRFSWTSALISLDLQQMNKGNTLLPYEEYKEYIPKEVLDDIPIQPDDIPDKSISQNKTNFITTGKNLFDKSKAIAGHVVNEVNGAIYANSTYYASDFIEIEPSTEYTETTALYTAFYDKNKTFISGMKNSSTPTQPRTFTTPANAYFIRTSAYANQVDRYQLEKSNKATTYEPYGLKLVNSLLDKKSSVETVEVFLPKEICVASGRTIELYNKQAIWCGNIGNFHVKWDCSIGKALKRKFSVTGTSALIGEYSLKLSVYDNNMNEVAIASTTIKVVPNVIPEPKKLLTIGDSLSNSKAWFAELRTLSSDKITHVGTRGAISKHEGRSGWSAGTYLTGASYTYEGEGVNPFWNGTRFNWNHYKTNTGINPDAVQLFLGTNGMALDPTTNASNIKQIVDYIRQDDTTIPIFVVFTLYRGNQDGIGNEIGSDGYAYSKGAWKLEEDRKVFNLMVRLYELMSGYSNLHFVPIALAHDSEYNFGAVETPVNPRATQTTLMPSEATHPQLQGYQQFADIMFSVFAKHLSA